MSTESFAIVRPDKTPTEELASVHFIEGSAETAVVAGTLASDTHRPPCGERGSRGTTGWAAASPPAPSPALSSGKPSGTGLGMGLELGWSAVRSATSTTGVGGGATASFRCTVCRCLSQHLGQALHAEFLNPPLSGKLLVLASIPLKLCTMSADKCHE